MAASKGPGTAFTWASGSSTTSGTTNPISCASDDADTVFGTVVIVGTPTAAPQVQIQESVDGGTKWYSSAVMLYSPTPAAGSYDFKIPLDPSTTAVRIVYTAQAGGTSSTLTAQLGQVLGT